MSRLCFCIGNMSLFIYQDVKHNIPLNMCDLSHLRVLRLHSSGQFFFRNQGRISLCGPLLDLSRLTRAVPGTGHPFRTESHGCPLRQPRSPYFRYLSPCAGPNDNTPMASATTYELHASTIDAIAPGRVRFIEHQGKRILFINYSHCDVAMLKAVAEEGHRVIALEPLNSVLTLNDVTGTTFDKESVALLQAKVAANAPYVRRAAVIGISGLQRLIYEGVKAFSRRRLPLFESRQEALAWLVQE